MCTWNAQEITIYQPCKKNWHGLLSSGAYMEWEMVVKTIAVKQDKYFMEVYINPPRLQVKNRSWLGKSRILIHQGESIWAEMCRSRVYQAAEPVMNNWAGILETRLRSVHHWNSGGFIISDTLPVTCLTTQRHMSVRKSHCEALWGRPYAWQGSV